MKLKTLALLAVGGLAGLTLYELARNKRTPTLPANTPRPYKIHIHEYLRALENGDAFDTALLDDTFDFIRRRYDCSDFLANSVIRALYAYSDRMPQAVKKRMDAAMLGFKYHWDQAGEDSLCTWSENHQILFAGLEYLAGARYRREYFSNSGRRGECHMARGRKRILAWCGRRIEFGFTEWNSNNYYLETLVALSNIQEFAPCADVRAAAEAVMHRLFHDMATGSLHGAFVTTGGRMYENNKKSARTGNMLNRIMAHYFEMQIPCEAEPFHEELTLMTKDMDMNMLLNKSYRLPQHIRDLAHDHTPQVFTAAHGIDIDDAVKRGLFGTSDEQLAAQWEMEAWTNEKAFAYSMAGLRRNNMFSSEFSAPLKMLNLTVLRPFYSLMAQTLRPVTNGKATQRADTYTYRTPHYLMATAQGYRVGDFSDQQHIWHVTLSHDVCVFATHPSGELEQRGALSKSPGYWVGNGRNPHAFQQENKILAIYHIPQTKALFEKHLFDYTHAYFPENLFDHAEIGERHAFGRVGDSYVALTAASPLTRRNADELIQYGKKQYWVCECSSADAETFDAFKARIHTTETNFTGNTLHYSGVELQYTPA